MSEEIIKIAAKDGIWTVLTVALIFYILKNQEKRDLRQEERENKYQNIITNLTEKLNVIEDIKEDVSEIKNFVFKTED
ncbi:BhlA/UviB family holin-like peptide [Paramaledivibacter caminithermalis]|uniref:BhlA/UviB family holin-like peptide n=1 Tax=Paramaledivibacter caminithermalis TaxID=191027 RepID=UPI0009321610